MTTTHTDPTATPDGRAGSVDHTVRLLAMFGEQRQVRVAEASRHLGVARSTAHRLLRILQAQGFIEQDPDTRAYFPGSALIRLAVSLVRGMDLRATSRPVMAEIVDQLGETAHLSILRGTEILIIESIESPKVLRVGVRTGAIRPAHMTASGRAMLADLTTDALHELYPQNELARITERTVGTRDDLEAKLVEVRRRGYGFNIAETEDGVTSVAVPVRDGSEQIAAALAITAPSSRLSEEEAAAVAAVLHEGAMRIGVSLLR